REALALWRGTAMQDVDLPDSPAFASAVARLDRLRLAAVEGRYGAEVDLGNGPDLVAELTDLVEAHPLRESLVAALMRAYAASGRDAEALRLYRRTSELLAEELGVDPSPELAAVHLACLRGEAGPPPTRLEVPASNLRAEFTTFVGRDDDVAAVRGLLDEYRLTTLIGPGGAGKTRLATEAGLALLEEAHVEVWMVELAALGPGGDVAQGTLDALGLRDNLIGDASGTEPADRVTTAIRDRSIVLLLDNCEHVIEQVAAFADRVLHRCPQVRILATSREPLGIPAEALWRVAPLGLPREDADADGIAAAPAVRLLWDRARAVRRDLVPDAATLQATARLCRALDGMPLAIELAAARLRTMSLDRLCDRLDDRLRLLTGGSRIALPRHRTLRAVIDWSWALLSDDEREVMGRLSVFADGASLEAAERVCADADHGETLDVLTALAEKSLLVAETVPALRYRMLSTIREYAAERLAETGGADAARRAHLAHFTELAEAAEPHLRRAEQLDWLAVLKAEHDDLNAAMRGALAAGEAQAAMRLAAAAGWYWWLSGHKAEGMGHVIAAVEAPGEVTDEVRARVYALISMFANSGLGDEHVAMEWMHRTGAEWIDKAYLFSQKSKDRHPMLDLIVPLQRRLRAPDEVLAAWEPLLDNDDPWVRALARLHRGMTLVEQCNDGPEADADLETALAEFRALGERFGMSSAQAELADRIAGRGRFAEACALFEQSIAIVTEMGAVDEVVRMRARQARLHHLMGDPDASAAALAEAERLAARLTWPATLAALALAKCDLARWSGDRDEAYRQIAAMTALLGADADGSHVRVVIRDRLGYLAEGLGEARAHREAGYRAALETGHTPLIALSLIGIADLALRRGDDGAAARMLAASDALDGLPDYHSHPDVAASRRAARTRLGETRFAEATAAARLEDWREAAEAVLAL
ncbi:MAG: AfsR/SARP family transcriptional regulator, partial [Glycomyces artemisiae]|nr:AfsR/SARP family transcriptional regulator [Glycomyces artemisiae]